MPKATSGRLWPLQRRFVEEYLIDLNATQAAIRAGYSPRTAYSQGQRLLKHVEVQAEIVKAQEARSRRTEVTQDAVLKKVAQMAFTNLDAFVVWEGKKIALRPSEEISPEQMSALQEIAETREGLRVKMADRMPALTLLFRHLRLLPMPGSKGDPLQLEHIIKEEEIDVSEYTEEELQGLQDVIGVLLAAYAITSSDSR